MNRFMVSLGRSEAFLIKQNRCGYRRAFALLEYEVVENCVTLGN